MFVRHLIRLVSNDNAIIVARSFYSPFQGAILFAARLSKKKTSEILHSFIYDKHIGYDRRAGINWRHFPDCLILPRGEAFEALVSMNWDKSALFCLVRTKSESNGVQSNCSFFQTTKVYVICQFNQIWELVNYTNGLSDDIEVTFRLHPRFRDIQIKEIAAASNRKYKIDHPEINIPVESCCVYVGSYSTALVDLAYAGRSVVVVTKIGTERLASLKKMPNVHFIF